MYSMKEAVKLTGLSYDTIKFYCNKGLVPNVKRDSNNYRIFDENTLKWLQSLSCLKNCGMSIVEMKQYLDYCLEGRDSIPKRKLMLESKRKELIKELILINEALAYIDEKQEFYDAILENRIEYVSNLIVK